MLPVASNLQKRNTVQLLINGYYTYNLHIDCGDYYFFYSKSFLLGFRDGSLERKPKVKREIKRITTV